MTSRPPVPNTAKFTLDWQGPDGVRAANIFYGLISGPMLANLSAATVAVGANTIAHLLPLVASSWNLESCTGAANDGTEDVSVETINTPGGVTDANALSPQVAAVVSWLILARYRGGHPRLYLPGIPTNAVDAGGGRLWSNTFITALDDGATAWLADINATPLEGGAFVSIGTIAYFRHNAPLVPPVFYPYQVPNVHPRLCTQRRRLGKEPTV